MVFVKHKNIFLGIAAMVVLASLAILFKLGLPLGIDFTGGSLMEVSYEERPEKQELTEGLNNIDLGNYSLRESVSDSGRSGYVLRSKDLSEPERIAIQMFFVTKGSGGEVERFTTVGPVIGEELKDKAVYAILGVIIVIIMYVSFAFGSYKGLFAVPVAFLMLFSAALSAGLLFLLSLYLIFGKSNSHRPVPSYTYAFITIVALIHDVLVPAAAFSVLGYLTGAEADVLFVMALLAVLGYSVNDTIVVFDRVRENLRLNKEKAEQLIATHGKGKKDEAEAIENEPFAQTVGRSVSQTITRSINTSVTTMITLGALYFLGGDVTENFALVLFAGVLAGTYSSIALANPLLVLISEHLPEPTPEDEKEKRDPGLPPGIPANGGYKG